MVIKSIIGTTFACITVVSFNTSAALIERLGGLAYYDDVADLTWLTDANAAKTSSYDADGLMNWTDANNWAAGLNVAGVTGWRLADTVQPDTNCGTSYGLNCTDSEMGNLFYNVLGGYSNTPISLHHNANYDLFSNIQTEYWSATEYAANTLGAWNFGMSSGFQNYTLKSDSGYAWVVQSGDIGAVPVPATVWLFGSGLVGLISIARKKTHA